LACPSFAAGSLEIADVLKVVAPNLNGAQGAERQLMEEDQTNRPALIKPPI
jgi:hypothetical protein